MADDFYINRAYYFESSNRLEQPPRKIALPKIAVGRNAKSAKRLWKDHEHVKITNAIDKIKYQEDDGPELYVPKFPRPFRTNPVRMIPMYKVLHAPSQFGTPRHNVKELYATATYLTNAVKNVDGNTSYKSLKAMHKIQKEALTPRPQTERIEVGQRLIWQSADSVTPSYTPRRLEPLITSRKSTGEHTVRASKGKYTNSPRESENTCEVSIHVPPTRRQKSFLEIYGKGRFPSVDYEKILLTKENLSHLEHETEGQDEEVMNHSARIPIGEFATETEIEGSPHTENNEVMISVDDESNKESREAITNEASGNEIPRIEKSSTNKKNELVMEQENRPDLPKHDEETTQSVDKEKERTIVKRDDGDDNCKEEENDIGENPHNNQTEEGPPTEVVETKENMRAAINEVAELEQQAEPVVDESFRETNKVTESNEKSVSCDNNDNHGAERKLISSPGETNRVTKCDIEAVTTIGQSLPVSDNQMGNLIQESVSIDSGFEEKPKSNHESRNVDLSTENANIDNIGDKIENKPKNNQSENNLVVAQDSEVESDDTRPISASKVQQPKELNSLKDEENDDIDESNSTQPQ
ncbi:uncharacterized protein LOC102803036 [Saccoglossus kowalevskii]|uniref:Myb-like protein X-like n=1 Tax=Saccoglossus kowalevskii TaxID=10224 RepID=A0ABM0MTR7_SACKO|nr:PREDICTED: myb-like protein X-like [Saccoglossus kowalevskii]